MLIGRIRDVEHGPEVEVDEIGDGPEDQPVEAVADRPAHDQPEDCVGSKVAWIARDVDREPDRDHDRAIAKRSAPAGANPKAAPELWMLVIPTKWPITGTSVPDATLAATRLLVSGPARTRPGRRPRRRLAEWSVSLEADPDLLSFQHLLLAFEVVVAPWLERDRKRLVLDVVGVLLDALVRACRPPRSAC